MTNSSAHNVDRVDRYMKDEQMNNNHKVGAMINEMSGSKMSDDSEPNKSDNVAEDADKSDECSWCKRLLSMGMKEHLATPEGLRYCTESCFFQSRRASFKRTKTCDWCKHIRHAVNYVDFNDGATQLQFCSDKCLNQYKMEIFCKETQAYLDMNPHLKEPNKLGSNSLITPEMWLNMCQEQAKTSSISEASSSPTPPPPPLCSTTSSQALEQPLAPKMSQTVENAFETESTTRYSRRRHHFDSGVPSHEDASTSSEDKLCAAHLPPAHSQRNSRPGRSAHAATNLSREKGVPCISGLPPPFVTLTVPYPIVIPLPIPIPIPLPLELFVEAYKRRLQPHVDSNTESNASDLPAVSPTRDNIEFDDSEPFDEPLDFRIQKELSKCSKEVASAEFRSNHLAARQTKERENQCPLRKRKRACDYKN